MGTNPEYAGQRSRTATHGLFPGNVLSWAAPSQILKQIQMFKNRYVSDKNLDSNFSGKKCRLTLCSHFHRARNIPEYIYWHLISSPQLWAFKPRGSSVRWRRLWTQEPDCLHLNPISSPCYLCVLGQAAPCSRASPSFSIKL